jgi:hypothetical protein
VNRPRKKIVRGSLLAIIVVGIGAAAVALAAGSGAAARRGSLTARIVLDRTRVQSGGTVSGRVIFENRLSKPILMLRGCVGGGMYQIDFRASDGYLGPTPFVIDGCTSEQSMVAKPGLTIFRFSTPTVYRACGPGDVQPKRSRDWVPPCDTRDGHSGVPSIPAGKYTAVFVPSDKWHGPRVSGARVTITKIS